MDETPVWFDMAGNFTIHTKGDKTIHIRGTGNEKNRFTVVLTCAADGTKFPAICIFKGKQMPRGEQAPSDGSEDDLVYEEIDELLKELQDENEEMDEIDFIDTN
ncbi:unnamed protein product [Rhizophagus irregularis]|nr:unnamed protein product [Rhizophagus irregularis]